MCGTCGCGEHHHHHDHTHEHSHGHEHHHHPDEGIVINLEQDILQRNNLLAERNRGYFEAKNLFCLNLMSSPGSGKTTLLEETFESEATDLCDRRRSTNLKRCRPYSGVGDSRVSGKYRYRLSFGSRHGQSCR